MHVQQHTAAEPFSCTCVHTCRVCLACTIVQDSAVLLNAGPKHHSNCHSAVSARVHGMQAALIRHNSCPGLTRVRFMPT
jgi:hypothetical protein